jgi:hypothetical protein
MDEYEFLGYKPRLDRNSQIEGRIEIGSLVRITYPRSDRNLPGGWTRGVDNSSIGVLLNYQGEKGINIAFPSHTGFWTHYDCIEEVVLDNEGYFRKLNPLPDEFIDMGEHMFCFRDLKN